MSERISAMDIERQEFGRRLRGYDADDVRLFLKSVSDEVQRLNLENGKLHEDIARLKPQVDELRAREKTLQETLISAQRMADEMTNQSRAEAELLVKEARIKAERILQQSQDQLVRIEDEIGRAKLERDAFERRLRSAVEQHLELLELRQSDRSELENVRVLRRTPVSEVG